MVGGGGRLSHPFFMAESAGRWFGQIITPPMFKKVTNISSAGGARFCSLHPSRWCSFKKCSNTAQYSTCDTHFVDPLIFNREVYNHS